MSRTTAHVALAALLVGTCLVGADEAAPPPREAEVLTVKPREATGAATSSADSGAVRSTGTYEEPFGPAAAPAPKLKPLIEALDPTRRRLIEEMLLEEELRAWEHEYLRRFGVKGPETLTVPPRLARPK